MDFTVKLLGAIVSILTLYFIWTGSFIFEGFPGVLIIAYSLPLILIFLLNTFLLFDRNLKKVTSNKSILYMNSFLIFLYLIALFLQYPM